MATVSMTSGMRANLQSLQQTNVLQEATMNRLATGKKVNSALDNATSYFTALSHKNRAADLLSFKDAIGEAIQTIKSADTAISGLTKLIESAKATAEAAKGVLTAGTGATKQTLTISNTTNITVGSTINVGGTTFTAMSAGATASTNFNIGTDAATTAANLAAQLNNETPGDVSSATVSNGQITITMSRTMVASDIEFSAAMSASVLESSVLSGADLAAKETQYTTLMSQIDDMKSDAFYKGKNLLGGAGGSTNDMTVRFGNSHSLVVASFDGSRSGLGMDAALATTSETTVNAAIAKLETALETLRTQSSNLSSNLAIVDARNEWISGIAETLTEGADKLTNADANQEGANLLMLQTRQSISTSALSMSSQAAQSVLRLFQ